MASTKRVLVYFIILSLVKQSQPAPATNKAGSAANRTGSRVHGSDFKSLHI